MTGMISIGIRWLDMVTPIADRLARNVQKLRADRGLTQVQLAQRARLTRQYVARIEMGRHDPRLSVAMRLARALDVPIERLVQ